ncbi:MAG: hypothetical protein KAI89_03535 [Emcibacter sp.]|nr:hypothetical protein [Emcibacter sp.]
MMTKYSCPAPLRRIAKNAEKRTALKNIPKQIQSSVGTALAWASFRTTRLIMDALPAGQV